MSTTPTSERASAATKPDRSSLRWLWVLLIVVIVAAGIALAWLALSGDEEPTVTFDGQTATYIGPTSLTAGESTFTFDATEYQHPVMFVVAEVTDDSLTLEDLEAEAATRPAFASGSIPPFIGSVETSPVVSDVVEETYVLSEGRWMVAVDASAVFTVRVYPLAILKVTSD